MMSEYGFEVIVKFEVHAKDKSDADRQVQYYIDSLRLNGVTIVQPDTLDDDHPLWCVNEQIKGLLEGDGASEDHTAVIAFLSKTGLPEGTVNRVHRALVNGEVDNPIVGHKTFADGSHAPLRKKEADAIMADCDAREAKRAADMPDDRAALMALGQAYQRLMELGWKEAMYCPKDSSEFLVIEAGSTGIHRCHYEGEWPTGCYWVHSENDLWPSRPILFKLP